jgi:hypothetical protein
MIPDSYEQWRHCIEVDCAIGLTPLFIAERLRELRDPAHERTRQFARLYGVDHLQRVVAWFERAAAGR